MGPSLGRAIVGGNLFINKYFLLALSVPGAVLGILGIHSILCWSWGDMIN